MKRFIVLFALIAVLAPSSAMAVDDISGWLKKSSDAFKNGEISQSYDAMAEALELVWQQMPLEVGKAVLVTGPSAGFGMYEQRPDNVFALDEPILLYVEPRGFRHKKEENGLYSFGVTVDFLLKTTGGDVLGGQTAFQTLAAGSRTPNREFFLSLTYNFSGVTPGEYVLETVLHDIVDGQTARVETPVVFK